MSGKRRSFAPVFAALGDETRLVLIRRLSSGEPLSLTQLTEGSALSRQAVTKHLRVLAGAGIVHGRRTGRETLYRFDATPLAGAKDYLQRVSEQWDEALGRLKAFVEH